MRTSLIDTKGRMAAVMAEIEVMKPELRRRRLRNKQERPLTDAEWDRRRDLDERGISAGEAYGDEHPMQSSATARRY